MVQESLKKLSEPELQAVRKMFEQHQKTAVLPRLIADHGRVLRAVDKELEARK